MFRPRVGWVDSWQVAKRCSEAYLQAMSAYVVWIDSREAKIFHLKPGKVDLKHLHAHGDEHTGKRAHGRRVDSHHPGADKLFHEVAQEIQDATEVLIVGPGEAKGHLKKHFETHHHGALAQKVVGVEPMDHLTENQILAFARKFFKAHDLFTGG